MRIRTNLEKMQGLIHDRWFDLLQVRHDAARQSFSISLGEDDHGPYHDKVLTVTDVSDLKVTDEADIRIYDLNEIVLEPGCVRLLSNFPLEIRLSVGNDCELSIQFVEPPCYYVPIKAEEAVRPRRKWWKWGRP